jgi:hypothetical protein
MLGLRVIQGGLARVEIADLKAQLLAHMCKWIPGFEAEPSTDDESAGITRLRNAEFDRLRNEAFKRWPNRDELDASIRAESASHKALESLDQGIADLRRQATEVAAFVDQNSIQIEIEQENDLIRNTAKQLAHGGDEFDVLASIRDAGHSDPISVLARGRLYAANVLIKR